MSRILTAALLVGILAPTLLAQSGTRYRDLVFTEVSVTQDISYGYAWNPWRGEWQTLSLDLYRPAGDSATDRPAMVAVHGGDFTSGSRSDADVASLATAYAQRGYVVVSIDYRLALNAFQFTTFPSQVIGEAAEDFKAAVRFLRMNAASYGIDTSRIGGIGAGAGAMTALAAAYIPNEGSSGNPGFSSEVSVALSLWGKLHDPTVLDAGEAPVFLVHGEADTTIPSLESKFVRDEALAEGVATEMHILPDVGHDAYGAFFDSYLDDALAFTWEHLELGQKVGMSILPGASAPGTVTFQSNGLAGNFRWLALADATISPIAYPGEGTLEVDLTRSLIFEMLPFSQFERIGSDRLTFSLPPSAAGSTYYAQELQSDPLGMNVVITNMVTLQL